MSHAHPDDRTPHGDPSIGSPAPPGIGARRSSLVAPWSGAPYAAPHPGDCYPCGTPKNSSRRRFMAAASGGVVGGAAATWALMEWIAAGGRRGQSALAPTPEEIARAVKIAQLKSGGELNLPLGIPGPYPGRVVEVNHAGAVRKDESGPKLVYRRDREVVKQMLARGMCDLVGCEEEVDAWRRFFDSNDVVGIKVVPVGQPHSISSFELVQEIIESLKRAGVRANNIIVFERYRNEFLNVGYHRILPAGVHWECSSIEYDEAQTDIDGQIPGKARGDHVAGYDRDVYREEPYCYADPKVHHPSDDRRFRSHLSRIITQKVSKFISIPVLKDHRSAGVTMCLKNLSHGSVNNVARSHIAGPEFAMGPGSEARLGTMNQCNQFIPAMVSLPPIREKAVLQIMDGLVGTYEGGPGNWNRTFAVWEYNSLFFGTDPVAVDRVGWEIIDAKRASLGLPSVGQMGSWATTSVLNKNGQTFEDEPFHQRHPQHVPLAATLGLGIFERKRINHQRVELAGA